MEIDLSPIDCKIFILHSGFDPLKAFLKEKAYSKCIVISDQTVYPLFEEELKQTLTECHLDFVTSLISPGETSKTLEEAEECWKQMQREGLDRDSLVIGLGGGVITDLAGFVGACYMRGIDAVYIPTTLMGMVDASIGGKTAVNLPDGKNLIGTFTHPKRIIISLNCLRTLEQRELSAGLAEVIKYGVICSPTLFEFLEHQIEQIVLGDENLLFQIIKQCCELKLKIICADEREQGERAILNFGHTIGHALETITFYQTFLHGEAVAIGMCSAAYLSWKYGIADRTFFERIRMLCKRAGLPYQLPHMHISQLIKLMKNDKKAKTGKIRMILGKEIGSVVQEDIQDEELLKELLIVFQAE